MIERNGDIFTTDATYIGHGVNCMGLMGAGIAKTVREKFPKTYAEYNQLCKDGHLKPGGYFAYPENDKVIVNLASQNKPGADASYGWLFSSLYGFAGLASQSERLERNGNLIALPEIGCGIGGLEWDTVVKVLEAIEAIYPEIEFEVWHYAPQSKIKSLSVEKAVDEDMLLRTGYYDNS